MNKARRAALLYAQTPGMTKTQAANIIWGTEYSHNNRLNAMKDELEDMYGVEGARRLVTERTRETRSQSNREVKERTKNACLCGALMVDGFCQWCDMDASGNDYLSIKKNASIVADENRLW